MIPTYHPTGRHRNKGASPRRATVLCSYIVAAFVTLAVVVPERADASFIFTYAGSVTEPSSVTPNIMVGDPIMGSIEFTIINPDTNPLPNTSNAVLNLIAGSFTVGMDTVTLNSASGTVVNDSLAGIDSLFLGLSFSFFDSMFMAINTIDGERAISATVSLQDFSGGALSGDNFLDALSLSLIHI